MSKIGRPAKTGDLITALKAEGRKKVNGWEKMDILVRGLWNRALPKDEEGRIDESGQGEFDLGAARFILEQVHGKPVERRQVSVDIFKHYPEVERERIIDLKEYDVK